jgi:hypothetical protein
MKSAQAQSTLQVSVLHGDLTHTNHPILLGHYEGDTIAGAERVVDKMVVPSLNAITWGAIRDEMGRPPLRWLPPMRCNSRWACSMARLSSDSVDGVNWPLRC